MAPSFLSLPLEIRLDIYGYLLHKLDNEFDLYKKNADIEHSATNTRMIFLGNKASPHLTKTAILGTCRQIYDESVDILYEENCFNHKHFTEPADSHEENIIEFPTHRLDMIQSLHLPVKVGTPFRRPHQVVDILHYLSTAKCSLKRLTLSVHLRSSPCSNFDIPYPPEYPYPNRISSTRLRPSYVEFSRDTSIASAVAELNISEEIRIELADRVLGAGRHCVRFVRSIAVVKGWTCHQALDLNEGWEDLPMFHGDWDFHWRWYLRPLGRAPARSTLCPLEEPDPESLTDDDNKKKPTGLRWMT